MNKNSASTEANAVYHQRLLTPINKTYFSLSKRLIDISLILISLPILLPVFIVIGVLIKLESKGELIFKQKRIGQYGKEFVCYKFRSMVKDADKIGTNGEPIVTKTKDARITRMGAILRKTNLDELPQLINVIKGDMSLVGPRPYPTQEHWYWTKLIPGFHTRTLVLPGLSGLAQVSGLRGGTLDVNAIHKRFEYDLRYIREFSTELDLKIIYRTIMQTIMRKTNAH